ncbi:MAG: DUF3160 domain-containing protein [Fidelibacterota bacterium]|nr:MAG: DUF3160 domain-containing protein [Candidatus Neomarinimicrobiota bacterium]
MRRKLFSLALVCLFSGVALQAQLLADTTAGVVTEFGAYRQYEVQVIAEADSQLVVTRGGMFSRYEFVRPSADRLTDEAWQAMQTGDSTQTLPPWAESYLNYEQDLSSPDPQNYYSNLGSFVEAVAADRLPDVYRLYPSYPNPVNPATTIHFDLPEATVVELGIFDLLGRQIARLMSDYVQPGYYEVVWNGQCGDGREYPSGIYVARLTTPQFSKSIMMVLLK